MLPPFLHCKVENRPHSVGDGDSDDDDDDDDRIDPDFLQVSDANRSGHAGRRALQGLRGHARWRRWRNFWAVPSVRYVLHTTSFVVYLALLWLLPRCHRFPACRRTLTAPLAHQWLWPRCRRFPVCRRTLTPM